MNDDWRLTIHVAEEHHQGFLERLGVELSPEARELARDLEGRRLAVSRDEETIFVYAGSRGEAEQARAVVEAELRDAGIEATVTPVEHWLGGEERWDDEPAKEYAPEEEVREEGGWPWEVRIETSSNDEAAKLGRRLRDEGLPVAQREKYVLVGAASEEEAAELASRLHGDVEASADLVYEVLPSNPFAIFGGLGGTGTPI